MAFNYLLFTRVITVVLPVQAVSVMLISRIFVLHVASFKARTQTIRKGTGGHYKSVNHFMIEGIFIMYASCMYYYEFILKSGTFQKSPIKKEIVDNY